MYYVNNPIQSLKNKYNGCVVEIIKVFDDYVIKTEEPIDNYLNILKERR